MIVLAAAWRLVSFAPEGGVGFDVPHRLDVPPAWVLQVELVLHDRVGLALRGGMAGHLPQAGAEVRGYLLGNAASGLYLGIGGGAARRPWSAGIAGYVERTEVEGTGLLGWKSRLEPGLVLDLQVGGGWTSGGGLDLAVAQLALGWSF